MIDKKGILERVNKLLEVYEKGIMKHKEKITKQVRKEFEKKFGFERRVDVKGIWVSKKKTEDKIIIEYLVEDVGNRQIEIYYKQAYSLIEAIEKIVEKSPKPPRK